MAIEWIINDYLASLIELAITDFVVTEVLLASYILYRNFISDEKLCAKRYQKVKDARTRECQFEDELRPRRTGGGVIRDPAGLPATSQSPSPPADGSLIRGEFLTDLRENKSV